MYLHTAMLRMPCSAIHHSVAESVICKDIKCQEQLQSNLLKVYKDQLDIKNTFYRSSGV